MPEKKVWARSLIQSGEGEFELIAAQRGVLGMAKSGASRGISLPSGQHQALLNSLSSSSVLIGKNHARFSQLSGAFLLKSILLLPVCRF
jgi:hypothetical protein